MVNYNTVPSTHVNKVAVGKSEHGIYCSMYVRSTDIYIHTFFYLSILINTTLINTTFLILPRHTVIVIFYNF